MIITNYKNNEIISVLGLLYNNFQKGTTSLCIEYEVAYVYRCGMECLISVLRLKL